MKDFFEIQYDWDSYPNRWHLDFPIDENQNNIDANMLPRRGAYSGPEIKKVNIDTKFPGKSLDFSFGYFNLILVSKKVADIIESYGGKIQRFPVTMIPTNESGYEVIFVLESPRGCIDLSRAEEFEFFEKDDLRVKMPYGGIPSRQKGMLYKIYDLYLVKEKIQEFSIFSPWEYPSIIISNEIKSRFEAEEVTGIKYRIVT